MRGASLAIACLAAATLGACVHTPVENAAVDMPWPQESPKDLVAYAPRNDDYPSVGGDILKGTSPADQELAREAAQTKIRIDPLPPPPPAPTP